jgi:hypothetical protein
MTDQTKDSSKNGEKMRGRQFEPGHPGGPGRPAGSRNKATLVLDALADGEAEAVLKATIDRAKEGDLRAAEVILSRVWPQRKGRPVTLELPKIETPEDILAALASVLGAATSGDLTPDEAALIGGLLENKRRAIETVQIEERLSRLEADAEGTRRT